MSIGTAAAAEPNRVEVWFHSSNPNFSACTGFSVRTEIDVPRRVTTVLLLDRCPDPDRRPRHRIGYPQ
jgi:hypothetical protein